MEMVNAAAAWKHELFICFDSLAGISVDEMFVQLIQLAAEFDYKVRKLPAARFFFPP